MSAGWNTIESDAGVFTYLIESLGVKDVQFEELVSLDSEELKQLSPIYGVIFLFKYQSTEQRTEQPKDGTYEHQAAENLFFANQVIQNACGTQALLSVLLNKEDEVDIGSKLREFKEFTIAFPADLRGEALSNSELIRDVHNSFARASPFIDETQRGDVEDPDVYHFIAYTCINNTLYELDGLQPAPISHGPCTSASLPDAVVPVLQRRIQRYPAEEIRFNLLAMVRDLRIRANELGDQELLEREEKKRESWLWENSLRRHNFINFIGEVLKGVVQDKVKKNQYEDWIENAKAQTKKRIEAARKKGEVED